MAHLTLSPEVRAVLESCTFRGLTVKMPPLSAKLYREVNKVLANAGGVWNRGQQAHVFTHDPREKLGLVLETGKSIDTQKLFQAFYTPTGLARRVVEMARVAGKRVLEPSGGVGALANRIAEQARELVVVELDPEAIGVLQQTGHYVVPGDFLEKTAEDLGGEFDAVVMNPPFSGDQDIRHVRHAFSMLKAGGDLVAIMSPGFTFGETRIRREFRQWQAELEADTYELAEGTFAESGTNIRTIILCLSKPMTHENSADEVQSEPAARAQGQRLDGVDLQTVLDSAANADELGRQQFFTPRDIATALCVPLPAARRTFVDLMMGDGALIAGAMAGNKHPSATGIGVDIDRRCARQPADLDVPVVTCSADLTRLYPLLEDLNWQYDLGGFNPPFSMKWYTDRLRTLAESEVTAVRTTFKAGKEHIDSTLASMLIALDRMTPGGEAFFICNHSTAVRLLGDPDLATAGEGCGQNDRHQQELANAPAAALRRHVWLWLTLPAGVFSNVRDFETAVLYFARAHDGDTPLHLTAPSAAASDIATTLATARSLRGVMRRGRHIYSMDQCSPTTVSLFRAAKDEYLRLVRTTDKPQWNLWLQDGTIRRYLTPFQTFSGKIPKPLIAKLNDLHGKTPMSLVVQKPSRMALLEALRTEFWRVQPELIEAVEVACRAYAAERAPYYPMNETQRIGFLDEEDTIICRKAFAGFTPGEAFVLESTTRKIERNFTRPNILGTEENVTLHGTELVIRVRHPQGLWWEFATFNDEELARPSKDGSRKARLELLPEHFIIPEVADVAMLHPEQYQANLAALAKLEERLAGKAGPRPPERGPAPTPINPSATHSLAIPTSEGNSSLAAPVQPTKKSTFAFRQYQRDDIARFCIHDGGVFAWDKGLGKTVALYSIMHVKGARRVLIVAPESLHEQIVQEGRDKFGVTVKALRSQADFYADAALQQVTMDVRNGRSSEVAGYWITSYTALGYNGGDEWGGKEDDNGEKIVSAKMKATRKLDPLWRS
ncbi:MAG TPA: methyltransferase, partial [Chthoniobacteraceae bacterium]